jgi:hypothetical protein
MIQVSPFTREKICHTVLAEFGHLRSENIFSAAIQKNS